HTISTRDWSSDVCSSDLDLQLMWDLLGHRRRLRALPRRVDERERAVEADFLGDLERLPEIVLGLAGKAHDDVGPERDIGDRRPRSEERRVGKEERGGGWR